MNEKQQITAFANDLVDLIAKYRNTCNLTVASLVGVIEVVKLELFHEVSRTLLDGKPKVDDEDEDEDED